MKLLSYILKTVEGKDGQLSIRRVMAFFVLFGMMRYVEIHNPIDATVLAVFSGLITALLALTTYQNIKENTQPPL